MSEDDPTMPLRWVPVASVDEQWALVRGDDDRAIRLVAKLGPYAGEPGPFYRVTGGESYSDHPTRDEAMAAAEASVE